METLTICNMKNLWDNLNLFKLVCVDKSLYFFFLSIMTGLFVVSILELFWILGQVVIKSLVLYLVLSKGQSYFN